MRLELVRGHFESLVNHAVERLFELLGVGFLLLVHDDYFLGDGAPQIIHA